MRKLWILTLVILFVVIGAGCSRPDATKMDSGKKVAETSARGTAAVDNQEGQKTVQTAKSPGQNAVNNLGNSRVNAFYAGLFVEQGQDVFFIESDNIYKISNYDPSSVIRLLDRNTVKISNIQNLNVIGNDLYFRADDGIYKSEINGKGLIKFISGPDISQLVVTTNYIAYSKFEKDKNNDYNYALYAGRRDKPSTVTKIADNTGVLISADENRLFYTNALNSGTKNLYLYNVKPTDMDHVKFPPVGDILTGAYMDLTYYVDSDNAYFYEYNPYYQQLISKTFLKRYLNQNKFYNVSTDADYIYLDMRNDKEFFFGRVPIRGGKSMEHSIAIPVEAPVGLQPDVKEPSYGVARGRTFYNMSNDGVYMVNLDGTNKMKFNSQTLKFVSVK